MVAVLQFSGYAVREAAESARQRLIQALEFGAYAQNLVYLPLWLACTDATRVLLNEDAATACLLIVWLCSQLARK